MATREEQIAVTTAFISALVEGVRLLGVLGVDEDQLYTSVWRVIERPAFDMIIAELIAQKAFKREGTKLIYCGPCMLT